MAENDDLDRAELVSSYIDFEPEPTKKIIRAVHIDPIPNPVEGNQIITLVFEDHEAAQEFMRTTGLPPRCRLITIGIPAVRFDG